MKLFEKIDKDLKTALKSKDLTTASVLRLVKSELKNKQIELGRELNHDDIVAVLRKEIKKRQEAAASFKQGGRIQQAKVESQEAKILAQYLPAEMSNKELTKIIEEAIAQSKAQTKNDLGKVMGIVMSKVAGRASGDRVAALVAQKLE